MQMTTVTQSFLIFSDMIKAAMSQESGLFDSCYLRKKFGSAKSLDTVHKEIKVHFPKTFPGHFCNFSKGEKGVAPKGLYTMTKGHFYIQLRSGGALSPEMDPG